jgi:chaperonin GroEL (HSP60 family)
MPCVVCLQIVSAGTNPVQLVRGMEKTVQFLVKELKVMSTQIRTDKDLSNVASVSAGGIGQNNRMRQTWKAMTWLLWPT